MPFQIHFQFVCPFRFYRTLLIRHNIIICWFSKASAIFAFRNSYSDFPKTSFGLRPETLANK